MIAMRELGFATLVIQCLLVFNHLRSLDWVLNR